MIYSNKRKLALSGWLQKNGESEYKSALKLQKFLLFYEAFSKVDGDTADFKALKGYQKGPVFSTVWGDYTHERESFDEAAKNVYSSNENMVENARAKKSKFLVSILSERELSELTHKMHLWSSKAERIAQGEAQVELSEDAFDEEDARFIRALERMYPLSFIEQSAVIKIGDHYFVLNKNDEAKLTDQHLGVMRDVAEREDLQNPVYVEIDSEGRLIID